MGGTPPPVASTTPTSASTLCNVTPAPHGYAAIHVEIDWKSMTGTFEVAYEDIAARHFNVKVTPWPKGCPWVEPMPDSPACHGPLLSYQVIFRSYGPGDAKPAGEKLVAGKTVLARVVQDMDAKGDVTTHLEPGDRAFGEWLPAVPVPPTMPCAN